MTIRQRFQCGQKLDPISILEEIELSIHSMSDPGSKILRSAYSYLYAGDGPRRACGISGQVEKWWNTPGLY